MNLKKTAWEEWEGLEEKDKGGKSCNYILISKTLQVC